MNRKNLIGLVSGFLIGNLFIFMWESYKSEFTRIPCLGDENFTRLLNLMSADECIIENETIFFLETNPKFKLFNGRRLCAFESAARHNPNRTVVVVLPENVTLPSENILFMEEFPNLYVHHLNYIDIISKSPQAHILEQIWKKKSINVHISDLMRPIILSMHGGAYMDSDTVSLKPFPSDIKNFLVEDVKPQADLNNGVLSFEKNNKFLHKVLEKMANPKTKVNWRNALGPPLMKSLRNEVCPTRNYTINDDRIHYSCPDVDALVLKRNRAHTWNTQHYTNLSSGNMTLPKLMDGIKDSFVIHYFGSKYDGGNLKLKKSSPLIGIMEENCPSAAAIIKSGLKS